MRFAEPIWLIAGVALIVALVFIYRLIDQRQRAAMAEFASSHLLAKLTASFSPARRMLKRGLFLTALGLICLALARPQWGYHWVEEKDRGIDLFFAIDTSKSMLTQDVNPDRLTRAKLAITDFVRKLDGDRVGLIAFAGEAFLQAPLTLDYDAFQDTLDSIDVNTIPRGGTDISSAIQEAQAAFSNSTQNKKILVLVTDGEDLQGQGIDAARAAAKDGMVIYTVGVGTANGGLVPVPNANGGTDFVKDPGTGEYVKSHLDESTLTTIAEATGGMYQPLGQQGQGLGVIYDKALASMPKHDVASRRAKVFEERFQWPLAAGLIFLFASMLIGTRRNVASSAKRAAVDRAATTAVTLLAVLAIPTMAHASAQSAESAYKKGDYNKAAEQYEAAANKQPDQAPLQYDLGAAAYKSGQFDTAMPAFQKALSSDDMGVQHEAYYGMGNTEYRIGQKTVQSSPQDTIKAWQGSVQSYDAALKLKPDDTDAKYNRDFVEKKLEKLEKQQKQQQQQNQQNKDQQNKDQQNNQDQNQQQQNQQQNQQNQNQQNQNQQQQNQQNQQDQSGSKGDQQNQQNGQQGNQDQQQQNGQNQAQNNGQKQDQKGQQQQQQSAGNQNQNKDQGGQQQQTAGNPNQNKDQNGQQQTAGNQDQKPGDGQNQPQNGSGGDQQKQMAQAQQKAGGATGQTAGADKDKQSSDQAADAALPAGELTKEQAKDLLNSLKGEEHILPVAADTRSAKPQDQPVLKDW